MATITLKYDAQNVVIKSILDAAVAAGATIIESNSEFNTRNLSPIERSIEDIREGRITHIQNIDNALEEIGHK